MNRRFEGEYVDGVYVGKLNGTISGLNCPKGQTLVDPNMKPAIYFMPDDTKEGEDFKLLGNGVGLNCENILPMYIISNYGRLINIATNKQLKPDITRDGYERYRLRTSTEKGEQNFSAHRLVLSAFEPIENMDKLQVNHKNFVKTDNYVNKIMDDGSIESNLEWCTAKENIIHERINRYPATIEDANKIREYKKHGYSVGYIQQNFYPNLKVNTIKYICENKIYYDKSYDPSKNPTPTIRMKKNVFSNETILHIRNLSEQGIKNTEIQSNYYPYIPLGTISDIITKKIHSDI